MYIIIFFVVLKYHSFSTSIRSESSSSIKSLQEKQTGRLLKILRSDESGEYVNAEMQEYCQVQGIHHETTTADTPQQNGVAEGFNCTLFEALCAMMHACS